MGAGPGAIFSDRRYSLGRPACGAMLLFGSLALSLLASAAAQQSIPQLKARVTDLTGTLSSTQINKLEEKLRTFEVRKGSQLAVLLVPSTKPETIEDYATRVFNAWGLGRGGVDDGILLLVARNDRALRIEVGYGLENAVSHDLAKRIIDEQITPRFKTGNYYGGIAAGVDMLIGLVDGEQLPQPVASTNTGPPAGHGGDDSPSVFGRIWLWIVGLFTALFALGGRGGSSGGGGFSGGGGRSGGGGASGSWRCVASSVIS